MENKQTDTYQRGIQHFGSQAALADALGISKQAVSAWGGQIPELRAYQVEALLRQVQPSP